LPYVTFTVQLVYMKHTFCALVMLLVAVSAAAQLPDTAKRLPPDAAITVSTTTVMVEDVMKKYIASIGGEDVLKKIKDLKTVRTAVVQNLPITITEMRITPDRLKITVEGANMVLQKVVLNRDSGYHENQGKKVTLSPQEVIGTRAEADLLAKLTPEKYGVKRELKGIEQVDSLTAYVVDEKDLTGKGFVTYYDINSGLLIKKTTTEVTSQGPQPAITTYSDYREVPGSGGYKIPHKIRQEVGMEMIVNSFLQSVEVNKHSLILRLTFYLSVPLRNRIGNYGRDSAKGARRDSPGGSICSLRGGPE
jgi:zinc protease